MIKIKKIFKTGLVITTINLVSLSSAQNYALAGENEGVTNVYHEVEIERDVPVADYSPYEDRVFGSMESKWPSNPNALLKDYPAVRNQGEGSEYGTCWAHAAIATAEFYKKQKNNIKVDYSELALAYSMYANKGDKLKGINGDKNLPLEGNFMSNGGNGYYAFMTLFRRHGVSDEKVAPYTTAGISKVKKSGLTLNDVTNNAVHIKNMELIGIKKEPEKVKQKIKENGAVFVAINSNMASYYNNKTNSYYCYDNGAANHAVVLVGWDDNYKATNFLKKPKGNGAWLVRNSWGTQGFSKGGYFWISYYDATLVSKNRAVYAVTYSDAKNDYDNNYQYDGVVTDSCKVGTPTVAGANIFTAHSGSAKEKLQAVALGCQSSNTEYTIEVFRNPNASNPTSGLKISEATTTGKFNNAGMYTVKLNSAVLLNKNERFSIVVTLKNKNGARMPMEYSSKSGWIETKASISKGQSFYKINNGKWSDIYGTGYGNLRIKALTDNVGAVCNDMDEGWHYNEKINAMQYYIKCGEFVKGWKWMDESTKETVPHHSFFNLKNGALYTGWHEMGAAEGEKVKHTSYFGSNGWLRTGWQWMDEKEGQKTPHWSYFGSNGWLRTGWVQMGKGTSEPDNNNAKHWSYFDSKGWLVTNCTLKINGNYYTFDDRGWLISEPFGLNGGRSDAKIAAGWYTINAFGNKKYCLDVSGASPENSANIILYQVNKTKAQKFYVEPKGNGIYRILTGTNNKKSTMDIAGNGKTSGTNVAQYVVNNTEAQLWKILKNPDGSVGIVALNSGLALDIEGNMYKNGSNITIYKMNSTKAQKFSFNKV